MRYLICYLITYVFLLVILFIFTYLFPRKSQRLGLNKGLQFILKKYDLTRTKDNIEKISKILVFTNAFILSGPITLVLVSNLSIFYVIGISLVLFLVLIFGLYNFIGFILKKKGW